MGGTIPHPRAPGGTPSGSANIGSCGAPFAKANAAAAVAPGSIFCLNRYCRAFSRSLAIGFLSVSVEYCADIRPEEDAAIDEVEANGGDEVEEDVHGIPQAFSLCGCCWRLAGCTSVAC